MSVYDRSLDDRSMDNGIGYALIVMFLMFLLFSLGDLVEASTYLDSLFLERMVYIPVLTVVLVVTWRYSKRSF